MIAKIIFLKKAALLNFLKNLELQWVLIGLCVLIVSYLALIPLIFLLWESFHTIETSNNPSQLTLKNYFDVYSGQETWPLFKNSISFAAGSSLFAFFTGTVLAWMNERTNTPFKKLFFTLSVVPLIIPGILFTVTWIFLASPKIGMLNLFLQNIFHTNYVFFDIYSIWGMIWVDGLHYSSMAFLMMTSAFRSMDPSLEESAMMSGANIFQIIWRVTIKLSWPAIFATLLILFVRSIESFEVPALLGLPVGIQVFTSSIYRAIHEYPSNVGLASSYGISLLIITSIGVYVQSRISGHGGKYSTVTGKGFRPRVMDLGKWRFLTASLFVLYFLMIVILPFAVLLWSSLQKYYAVPSLESLKNLSWGAYTFILAYPELGGAIWNSFLLAISCATIVMLITAVICWLVLKTKMPGRWLVDNLASLPIVFPGMVLGLSIMVFYLHVDIGIYGSMWIMLLAFITRFLPYGMRYNTTAMLQIHKELEESAGMSGASWFITFKKVTLPLLKPGLMAGWIYILIVSIRELSTSILLSSPDNQVVSVLIWELWENGQYIELSALGVMLIISLFILVMLAQLFSKRFGVKEA